jgi:hypothetical protein
MTDNFEPIKHPDPSSPTTTKDGTDAGVPMAPPTEAEAKRPAGPEDAMDPTASNRGQYDSKRVVVEDTSEHYTSEVIPEAERVEGGPITRLVKQSA